MSENKTKLKEKLENNHSDLEEILGNIKNVVAEEKQSLSLVEDYKIIKLTKKNLVKSGKINLSEKENFDKLEELVRKIVKEELKDAIPKMVAKEIKNRKSDLNDDTLGLKGIQTMRKSELIELCKKNNIEISLKHTKAFILEELRSRKIVNH